MLWHNTSYEYKMLSETFFTCYFHLTGILFSICRLNSCVLFSTSVKFSVAFLLSLNIFILVFYLYLAVFISSSNIFLIILSRYIVLLSLNLLHWIFIFEYFSLNLLSVNLLLWIFFLHFIFFFYLWFFYCWIFYPWIFYLPIFNLWIFVFLQEDREA